jgi:flagellar biosynthesis/type III secretory pathway M-ring protein FliF/YscJ
MKASHEFKSQIANPRKLTAAGIISFFINALTLTSTFLAPHNTVGLYPSMIRVAAGVMPEELDEKVNQCNDEEDSQYLQHSFPSFLLFI